MIAKMLNFKQRKSRGYIEMLVCDEVLGHFGVLRISVAKHVHIHKANFDDLHHRGH